MVLCQRVVKTIWEPRLDHSRTQVGTSGEKMRTFQTWHWNRLGTSISRCPASSKLDGLQRRTRTACGTFVFLHFSAVQPAISLVVITVRVVTNHPKTGENPRVGAEFRQTRQEPLSHTVSTIAAIHAPFKRSRCNVTDRKAKDTKLIRELWFYCFEFLAFCMLKACIANH
jgi:hypothetical protein